MALPQDSAKYLSLFDSSPPRSRQPNAGLSASIWAPQTQPLEHTWPRALDSFSRTVQGEGPDFQRSMSHQKLANLPLITREDVFGALNATSQSIKDIGAIGDGRKKITPEDGDTVDICYLNSSYERVFLIDNPFFLLFFLARRATAAHS